MVQAVAVQVPSLTLPMSAANVQTVLSGYAAFNERDFDRPLACFADDAEHDWSRSVGPYAGVYRGRAQILRFWNSFLEAVHDVRFDVEEALDLGDDVLVMVAAHVQGRESGAEVVARGPHVWTLRDGRVVRFELFQTREEALRTIGVSSASARGR